VQSRPSPDRLATDWLLVVPGSAMASAHLSMHLCPLMGSTGCRASQSAEAVSWPRAHTSGRTWRLHERQGVVRRASIQPFWAAPVCSSLSPPNGIYHTPQPYRPHSAAYRALRRPPRGGALVAIVMLPAKATRPRRRCVVPAEQDDRHTTWRRAASATSRSLRSAGGLDDGRQILSTTSDQGAFLGAVVKLAARRDDLR